jgi:hypothetical protein
MWQYSKKHFCHSAPMERTLSASDSRQRPGGPKAISYQSQGEAMKLRIFTVPFLMALLIATASAQYTRTDLISNQPGVAPTTDAHLVNAWGLTALPASVWWVSDNGTGFSTLYNGAGVQTPLFGAIPPAPGSPAETLGTPTGTVANISPTETDFTITENGVSGRSAFIFATLDGTISAWNPVVDGATGNTPPKQP